MKNDEKDDLGEGLNLSQNKATSLRWTSYKHKAVQVIDKLKGI